MKRAIVSALLVAAAGYLAGAFVGTIGCTLGLAAGATGCIVYELEFLRCTIKLKGQPEETKQ